MLAGYGDFKQKKKNSELGGGTVEENSFLFSLSSFS
jgi:hypothetical protein